MWACVCGGYPFQLGLTGTPTSHCHFWCPLISAVCCGCVPCSAKESASAFPNWRFGGVGLVPIHPLQEPGLQIPKPATQTTNLGLPSVQWRPFSPFFGGCPTKSGLPQKRVPFFFPGSLNNLPERIGTVPLSLFGLDRGSSYWTLVRLGLDHLLVK